MRSSAATVLSEDAFQAVKRNEWVCPFPPRGQSPSNEDVWTIV